MRCIIFLLISTLLFSCKGPSGKKEIETYLVLENIEIDTLLTDIYGWPFFVTSKEDVYFIKSNNTLYFGSDPVGKIPITIGAERFLLSKDYLAFSFIDSSFNDLINIYKLEDLSIASELTNSFIIDVLFEKNMFIVDNYKSDGLQVYSMITDEYVFEFSEIENKTIIDSLKIYTYNATVLKDENGELTVNSYDKNTFTKENEFIIDNPQGWMVIAFLQDCYVAAKGNLIFFVDFQGKVIENFTLPTNNKYQVIVTGGNSVSFYFWDVDIEEEFDDFNFVRQKVTIINAEAKN